MLKEKLKITNKNFLKINAIYLLLIISNIVLFIGLINYFPKVGINLGDLNTIEDIASIIAATIILGYISTRLPKIKDLGDSSVYGMIYTLVICIIGLMTSYFTDKFHTPLAFGPYLGMFKVLCAVLIFVIIAITLKPFKEIIQGKFTRKNQIICLITFVLCGLFASYVIIRIGNTPANIRCLIVMISGLFGGPVVGIPVGIISGAYRYTLGGPTALPCAISTVISGIIGSLIFKWNDKKFPKAIPAIILMFLFTGFEMMLIIILTPQDISFPFVSSIYPVMLFGSVIGMLLFTIVIKEAKQNLNPSISEEEQKINEIKNELEKHYDEKIEEMKNELEKHYDEKIEELKKNNDSQDE